MDDSQILTQMVVQCWKDDSFKQSFLNNPKTVLAEFGMECRGSVEISVIEDSPNQKTFVIPGKPEAAELAEVLEGRKAACAAGAGSVVLIRHLSTDKPYFTSQELPG